MEGVRTGRVVLDWLLLGPFSIPPTFATKKAVGKVWSLRNAMSALFEKKKNCEKWVESGGVGIA